MILSLALLILSLPTIWELWSERKGEDPKQKGRSMSVRALLMIVCSVIAAWIIGLNWLTFLKSLFLSFAIFFGFFDYAINLILGRKPWHSYLSKSPIDQKWSKVHWRWRMAIRGVVFVTAITIFLWK